MSDAGASGVGVRLDHDLKAAPNLSWRWKVAGLVEGADNSVGSKEDSPARIVLSFDGDKSKLSFSDRTTMSLASKAYGRDLPYATLMYVWSNERAGRHGHLESAHQADPDDRRVERQGRRRPVAVDSSATSATTTSACSARIRARSSRSPCSPTATTPGTKVEAWYGDLRFTP